MPGAQAGAREVSSPNTQTSVELSTAAPPIEREKDRITVHCWPFQRSAREMPNSWVNAQTSVAEVAAAAATISLFWLGKGTCVQADPFRSQAVAFEKPSNAHPPFRPTAVTAVTTALEPLATRLTMCQDGAAETWAAMAVGAQPATAATAAATSAARRTVTLMCFQPFSKPLDQPIRPANRVPTGKTAETAGRQRLPHHSLVTIGSALAQSVTARPGLLIVPGGQYQVMISMASRPAWTAGSASASCRACSSDPVR